MVPQVELFSFVFRMNWRHQKRHFEINWPLNVSSSLLTFFWIFSNHQSWINESWSTQYCILYSLLKNGATQNLVPTTKERKNYRHPKLLLIFRCFSVNFMMWNRTNWKYFLGFSLLYLYTISSDTSWNIQKTGFCLHFRLHFFVVPRDHL
jgi:hypothetical protein